MRTSPNLAVLIRQRNAALRNLARFDKADKGSKWFTHSEEGARLLEKVQVLDAAIEAEEQH